MSMVRIMVSCIAVVGGIAMAEGLAPDDAAGTDNYVAVDIGNVDGLLGNLIDWGHGTTSSECYSDDGEMGAEWEGVDPEYASKSQEVRVNTVTHRFVSDEFSVDNRIRVELVTESLASGSASRESTDTGWFWTPYITISDSEPAIAVCTPEGEVVENVEYDGIIDEYEQNYTAGTGGDGAPNYNAMLSAGVTGNTETSMAVISNEIVPPSSGYVRVQYTVTATGGGAVDNAVVIGWRVYTRSTLTSMLQW